MFPIARNILPSECLARGCFNHWQTLETRVRSAVFEQVSAFVQPTASGRSGNGIRPVSVRHFQAWKALPPPQY
ncbi:MAG TPA: hypothetical protein PLO92_08175, partial [Anaerolineaceae bacterium]|nr:hypothetical protein [Anaerolineaceae bacterium]